MAAPSAIIDMRQLTRPSRMLSPKVACFRKEIQTTLSYHSWGSGPVLTTAHRQGPGSHPFTSIVALRAHAPRRHAVSATVAAGPGSQRFPWVLQSARGSADRTTGSAEPPTGTAAEVAVLREELRELREMYLAQGEQLRQLQSAVSPSPAVFTVGQYNILAGYLGCNRQPWFLYGVPMPPDRRAAIMARYSARDDQGVPIHKGWPNYVEGILSPQEQATVERVSDEVFAWDARKHKIMQQVAKLDVDVLSLVECDHYDDFFHDELRGLGYESVWHKRPRELSQDGCCIAWRACKLECLAIRDVQYIDRFCHVKRVPLKDRIALIALLKVRLTGERLIFVSTHLTRNPEEVKMDRLRVRQIGQVMQEIGKFAVDNGACEAPVVLAGDLNATSFTRLEEFAKAIAVMQDQAYIHEFMSDCQDIQTGPTSVTTSRRVRIDALLYQSMRLKVVDVLQTPPLDPADPLPNREHPSDHVPVKATLRMCTRQEQMRAAAQQWFDCVAGRTTTVALSTLQLQDAFEFFAHDTSQPIELMELVAGMNTLDENVFMRSRETREKLEKLVDEVRESEAGLGLLRFEELYVEALRGDGSVMPRALELQAVFSMLDLDGSGSISCEELVTMLSACSPAEIPREKIVQLFKSMDLNNDQTISQDEFVATIDAKWRERILSDAREREGGEECGCSAHKAHRALVQDHVTYTFTD